MSSSLSRMIRWASRAMSGAWVTRTIVRPSPWKRSKSAMISSLLLVSRFPVGSSAIRISGSVTGARAIAMRGCSPPESGVGRP